MLTLIVSGKQYKITKSSLKQQMKTGQNSQLDKKNVIQLPSWVEKEEFEVIYEYLMLIDEIKDLGEGEKREGKIFQFLNKMIVKNLKFNNTKKLINVIRISDYLTLQRFQQYFIQKCVIQSLNNNNCIIYLQQTHKKLKNSSSGTSQAWYNLLNSCIDYISYNLSELYLKQSERIQKLHQKILGQILDRTIKYQLLSSSRGKQKKSNSSNNNFTIDEQKQKQIVFNLLMKSKKSTSVDTLCNSLKINLLNKKINKKMHAKLSWKLHDLHLITDKKIKSFKFLDLNWILEAIRTPEKTLQVKLTLLPSQSDTNNYSNYSIGIFYSKLYWNFQKMTASTNQLSASQTSVQTQLKQSTKNQGQNPLQIHYICMKNPKSIIIYEINKDFEQILVGRKLQLSIYCSIDHCYSFVINYIINDYDRLRIDEKKLTRQQIYSIIQGSKSVEKYSQSVRLIKYLQKNQYPIPIELLQNIKFDKLPTYEIEFLKKLIKTENNSILDQIFGKKQINNKSLQIENQLNSLSRNQINSIGIRNDNTSLTNSKISQNLQTKSNHSRANSRTGHRKIFGESPQKDRGVSFNKQPALVGSSQNIVIQPSSMKQIPIINQMKHQMSQGNYQNQKSQLQIQKQQRLKQILQITNMKNYFYDKNSQVLSMI